MEENVLTKKSLPYLFKGKRMLAYMMLTMVSASFTFAQNWIDVTDTYIKNADYSTGTSEGWTDGDAAPVVNGTEKNAEFYQKQNTAAQLISITPGQYKLTVRGFHRAGGNDNGAAYDAGTEVINAYLFAGESSVSLASLYSAPKDLLTGSGLANGWPNTMTTMRQYCELDPSYYLSTLEFTVQDAGNMLIGIRTETNAGGTWTCWDDFKLYISGTKIDAFKAKAGKLKLLRDSLSVLGAAAASELTAIIDKYADYTGETPDAELDAAISEVDNYISTVSAVIGSVFKLKESILKAENLLTDCEAGTYYVSDATKASLATAIATAKGTMNLATIADLSADVDQTITDMDTATANVTIVISLSYPLSAVKNLADRIGGLDGTAEYQKVVADLNAVELSFDDVILDVQTLNEVCKNVMDAEFLGTASDENPIDLTSFITNPNIYQNGASSAMPTGWICDRGSADSPNVTGGEYSDTEFFCYSWSGNGAHNIGTSHYYQKVGGEGEGIVNLPDGLYMLKAATCTSAGADQITLYASSDSANFSKTNFNTNEAVYKDARSGLSTTTELSNIEVRGGVLYFGVKGKYVDESGYVGGTGKWWNADNFRLYYISASAVTAYQDRLKGRIAEGVTLHNTLVEYGIDDSEYLAYCLGEDSLLVTSESIDEIEGAIAEMDEVIAVAKTIIANYEALSPLVTAGENLNGQLENGLIVAQPAALAAFITALENAEEVYADLSWDNIFENTTEVTETLKTASTTLKASVAVCYPLAKAKLLAEQIGGISDNAAYLRVVNDLKNDNLEQMDADLDVAELNAVCIAAMTPEVQAKATPENPFDMTSLIINPNIYQNAVDETTGDPINTVINGWVCETNADSGSRTNANTGDTWLTCYSWSGHAGHNVGLGTNYYQILGENGEGTIALPDGTYRITAATQASSAPEKLELYALTRESYLIADSVAYRDSVYYVNTFNGDAEAWELAQSTVSTTTDVSSIYVENGSLVIGIKGNAVVTGTGQWWNADNFRLYYIGAGKIDDSVELPVFGTMQSEHVDVYDLAGRLVRKQVKTANATDGLKKGFYIVGGKKCVVK